MDRINAGRNHGAIGANDLWRASRIGQHSSLLCALFGCCLVAAWCSSEQLARADSPQDGAEQVALTEVVSGYVQRANEAVRSENFDEARQEWAFAYLIQPTPEFLFNLAEACRKLSNLRDARYYYQRFLAMDPHSPFRAQAISELTNFGKYPLVMSVSEGAVFKSHIDRARSEFVRKNYIISATEYIYAYPLDSSLRLLPNIGQALLSANKKREALLVYSRYAEKSPPSALRDQAVQAIKILRDQLATEAVEKQATTKLTSAEPPQAHSPIAAEPPATAGQLPNKPQPTSVLSDPVSVVASQSAHPRQRSSPFFELRAGALLSGRKLQFRGSDTTSNRGCFALRDVDAGRFARTECSEFFAPIAAGLHADLAIFPLASVPNRGISGLGLLGRIDYTPAYSACANPDSSGHCIDGELTARQLRVEAGLWWRWPLSKSVRTPVLSLVAQYGLHNFTFESATGSALISLPNSSYQYINTGLGIELPWRVSQHPYVRSAISLSYHAMLAYGGVAAGAQSTDDSGYGPIDQGHGARIDISLVEINPWRGLSFSIIGNYEIFYARFSIQNPEQTISTESRFIASEMIDQYFGGSICFSYRH